MTHWHTRLEPWLARVDRAAQQVARWYFTATCRPISAQERDQALASAAVDLFAIAPCQPPDLDALLGGRREAHLHWPSTYEMLDPETRSRLARFERVQEVHLYALRRAPRTAKGALIVVHGWGTGAHFWTSREFALRQLGAEANMDVYTYVLPFHAERCPRQAPMSGALFPSLDLALTNATLCQCVAELRGIVQALAAQGSPVALLGTSLGGYLSALVAACEPALSLVVPVATPASLAEALLDMAGAKGGARLRACGYDPTLIRSAWGWHSPLNFQPLPAWDRRLMVRWSADAVVPEPLARPLWEHWQRPRRLTFAGAHHHLTHLERCAFAAAVAQWLRERL